MCVGGPWDDRFKEEIEESEAGDRSERKRMDEKENKPSEFIHGRKESYLDSTSVSPTCIERDGNKAEAQNRIENNKIKSISDKFSRVDDSSSSEFANNSLPLFCVADAETVSVTGPSGIHTRSQKTGKEKCFVCNFFGKVFSRTENLHAHQRTHTGEKPFVCQTCGKRFTEQGHLIRHLRTHTGDKPYPCPKCEKNFRQKPHLKNHLLTRAGEKPFACHICRKGFAKQYKKISLACHLRTHTGEKPCKCQLCDMTFANRSNCDEHCKRKYGGK
ncbi:Histone-lysine N-methyltransferase PRDM9 [Araneus ventricosus]|uniref:Histone-lysine N-methyltransferase PRDM9 n=1 Tax=Araneus ventricosus TaxID=182803 RepID=A0A4Y2L220_ARAVE|nr:Histone-lysine N-methyltransferase PRDM9 [Araneus ventricosus]